jgi:hypothetical protein
MHDSVDLRISRRHPPLVSFVVIPGSPNAAKTSPIGDAARHMLAHNTSRIEVIQLERSS